MADNVDITPGTGNTIAADEVVDGTLGTVKVQYVKIMDGALNGTSKAAVGSNGLAVDGSAVVQPISAATLPLPTGASTSALQTTGNSSLSSIDTKILAAGQSVMAASSPVVIASNQSAVPISGTVTANIGTSGSLALDATLTGGTQKTKLVDSAGTNLATISAAGAVKVDGSAVTQPVSGTFFQATQPVSGTVTVTQATGTNLHTVVDSGTITAVTAITNALPAGSNVIGHVITDTGSTTAVTGTVTANAGTGTFAVSAASLPLPTGAATETTLASINTKMPSLGQTVMASSQPVTIASNQSAVPILLQAANLWVTVTAATGVAATLTLPAVAANFHYITYIEIMAYSTAARTGGATPVLVTTTNMVGSPVWTFATAAAIGMTDSKVFVFDFAIKSSVVNTSTTIVCPATTGIIWRVNVSYYTGA